MQLMVLENMQIHKISKRFYRERKRGSRREPCGTTHVKGKQKKKGSMANREGSNTEVEGKFLKATGKKCFKKRSG